MSGVLRLIVWVMYQVWVVRALLEPLSGRTASHMSVHALCTC